ncbi:MAG: transporter substrate-binding domain-containing protein [Hyphomicrobiaceae bacterium]|nr:transporter substrate-binding domain-containing protein [Hyphomicrobiaceae bacterium]
MRYVKFWSAIVTLGCAGGLAILALSTDVRAQTFGGKGAVTILTDAIASPNGRAGRAVLQLAKQLAAKPGLRVLAIAGRGGSSNVDDLLGLRGIDMAVVNSDVLAFKKLTRSRPAVRGRLELVGRLFSRRVLLLARKSTRGLSELAGTTVVAFSGAGYETARAVFGLSQISVDLVGIDRASKAKLAGFEKAQAVVLLEDEIERLPAGVAGEGQPFSVISLPLTPSLATAYDAATIAPGQLSGVAVSKPIATIEVATVLATYHWRARHQRYTDVGAFMKAYLLALPLLRQAYPTANWGRGDLLAPVPGWKRHPLARPEKVLPAAQIAALGTPTEPIAPKPVAVVRAKPLVRPQPNAGTVARPPVEDLRVSVLSHPPFAGKSLAKGGLALELLGHALAATARATRGSPPHLAVGWAPADPEKLGAAFRQNSIDISLPWPTVRCDRPAELTLTSAILCDNVLYSEPLMQVVLGLYVLSNAPISLDKPDSLRGKTLCAAEGQDLSRLNETMRRWIASGRVTLMRRATALDCVAASQRRQADGFIVPDLEGRHLLKRLGVQGLFRMDEQPLATVGLHAVVSKTLPNARQLIRRINDGIRRIRQNAEFAAVMRRHLQPLLQSH